jgi:hypothetical protein
MLRDNELQNNFCLTTRNRNYANPAENSMVALIRLGKPVNEKLDYDKAWWVKWTNAAYKNTRNLALTRCDQNNDVAHGVSYDDSEQHFVYWKVKFDSFSYSADYYYPGTTFIQAAAFFSNDNISGATIS